MKTQTNKTRRVLLAAGLSIAVTSSVLAQPAWPSKPIKLVVPYPAGGSADAIARLIGQQFQQRLGAAVVIENRPGANANIGAEVVVRSAPDGYTMLVSATYMGANPALDSSLRWSPGDLVPVARYATAPNVMVVPANSPLKSIQDLIAAAKADPEALNYGEGGDSVSQTLAMETLKMNAGIQVRPVRYAGGPPIIGDLSNGSLSLSVMAVSAVSGMLSSGRLRAIVTMSSKRSPLLPDVPTVAEAGFPNAASESWYGLHVAKGTSPDIIGKLAAVTRSVSADEEVQKRLVTMGAVSAFLDTAAFDTFLREDAQTWIRYAQARRQR